MIQLQETVTVQAPNEIDPESCDGIGGGFRLDEPIRTVDCFSPMQRGAMNNVEQRDQVCAQNGIVCDYVSLEYLVPGFSGRSSGYIEGWLLADYRRSRNGKIYPSLKLFIPESGRSTAHFVGYPIAA
jgi:hypothetical protein